MRGPKRSRRAAVVGLTMVLALGLGSAAQAQHTPDPYNIVGEYNRQYEPYMYATDPNSSGIFPNQGLLEDRAGYRSANRFQNYLADSESGDLGLGSRGRSPGAGSPYYRAYNRFDQSYDRSYRPNETADQTFYSEKQQLNEKYFRAIGERDAKKRAQLLREYNIENLRATRNLSTVRTAPERDRYSYTPGTGLGTGRGVGASSLSSPDEETSLEPRRPSTAPATGPLRSSSPSSLTPATRSRTGLDAVRPSPSTTTRRGVSGLGSSLPFGSGSGTGTGLGADFRTGRSPSAVLERSELMDRATRSTAPVTPRTNRSRTLPPNPRTEQDVKPQPER